MVNSGGNLGRNEQCHRSPRRGTLTLAGGTLASVPSAGRQRRPAVRNIFSWIKASHRGRLPPETSTISAIDVALTQTGGTVFTVNPRRVEWNRSRCYRHASSTGLTSSDTGLREPRPGSAWCGSTGQIRTPVATNITAGTPGTGRKRQPGKPNDHMSSSGRFSTSPRSIPGNFGLASQSPRR